MKAHLPSMTGGSNGLNPALKCDPDPGAGGGERVLAIGDSGPCPTFLGDWSGGGGGGGPGFRNGDAAAIVGDSGGGSLLGL